MDTQSKDGVSDEHLIDRIQRVMENNLIPPLYTTGGDKIPTMRRHRSPKIIFNYRDVLEMVENLGFEQAVKTATGSIFNEDFIRRNFREVCESFGVPNSNIT